MIHLTPKELRHAADLKDKIDALEKELNTLLGGEASTPAAEIEAPKKRKLSAAGRAAIAAAARARWAEYNAAKAKPVEKARKTISAAGLANIRAAQKARWAAKRAQAQPAPRREKPAEAPKKKRKMTAAWRRALERAWAARRAKA
jgi:cell division septum initiation protein DivIVA